MDEFLRPAGASNTNPVALSGPKLDIPAAKSHGVAAAQDGEFLDSTTARIGGEGGIPSYAPTREDMLSGKWRPTKPSRRPGLRVAFADGTVETIGEGGDEAEDATVSISQRRPRTLGSVRTRATPARPPGDTIISSQNSVAGRPHRSPTGPSISQTPPYPPSHHPNHHDVIVDPVRQPSGHARRTSDITRRPVPPPHQPQPHDVPPPEAPDEQEIIRPLRRAPTGLEEARNHQRAAGDAAAELHLSSPESPPGSKSQQDLYERHMQRILTDTYAPQTTSTENQYPLSAPPRKPSAVERATPTYPDRPSLRTRDPSAGRSPRREAQMNDPSQPEIRSPVDSSNMRKMRAEEGLAHRSSVQGIHGVPGGDGSVSEALAKLSSGLGAPPPYSTQARSSFDSMRSGSDRSRYSVSPEPTSLPRNNLHQSVGSTDGGQFLSPPSSSHGLPTRHQVHQSEDFGSVESLPPEFTERARPSETSLGHGGRHPLNQPEQQEMQSTPSSNSNRFSVLRSPGAEEAFSHFAQAIVGTSSILRLSAENTKLRATLYDWVQCALWWFLKGKEGIEEYIRNQFGSKMDSNLGRQYTSNPEALRQHHLNLAKAYWILSDVVPGMLNDAQADPRSYPPSQSLAAVDSACDQLSDAFKVLSLTMRKYDILPPPEEKFTQGLDNSIWTTSTFDRFPPDWQWVLSGKVFAPPRQTAEVYPIVAIPLQDDRSTYCYGRVFTSATIAMGEDKPLMEPFECVMSFTRDKGNAEAEVVISSQTNDLNIYIRAAGEHGVHWEHTRFDHNERCLRVKLPQKLRLRLFLSQRDYNWLWNFYDNSTKTSQSLLPRKNERLLQTFIIRSFHYRDTMRPDDFPSDPVGTCKAALFEQSVKSEKSRRRVHTGFRFAVVNLEKTVRSVNISLGKTAPLEYNVSSSQPTIQLQLNEVGRRRSAHIVFDELSQRDIFRDLVSGTVLAKNESVLCKVQIASCALSRATTATNLPPAILRWSSLQVIDEDDPEDPQHLSSSADVSEALRVMMYSKTGSIIDRMNDAVVDLKVRLEPAYAEQLQIFRSAARNDMTVTIGPDPSETNELRQIFDVASSGPHLSVFTFNSLKDLHAFQKCVTGFRVIYDGVASSFSIPRRKPGSVMTKQMESKEARVQIVERDRVTQLIAFFQDYILADSINFELKRTDQFDKADSKTLGPGVKIVDAKFVLPGSGKDDPIKDGAVRDVSAKYTAFDTYEYAAEHDDITISFRSEEGRYKDPIA